MIDVSVFRKLERIPATIQPRLLTSALAGGAVIRDEIKDQTPVDTGNLKDSYHCEVLKESEEEVVIGIGTDVEYAKYLEFGTGVYAENGQGRKTPWTYYYQGDKGPEGFRTTIGYHHPHVRPAFDVSKEKAAEVTKESLEGAI